MNGDTEPMTDERLAELAEDIDAPATIDSVAQEIADGDMTAKEIAEAIATTIPSAYALGRAIDLRAGAKAQHDRRAAEVQRMRPDARVGAAVRLLITQLKRLRAKPCPTMKFGIEPDDVLAAVRSEVDEVDAEVVGSDAAHCELGGLLSTVLHLTVINSASVESVLVDEEHRLRLRNDEVEAGGTWEGAKARERPSKIEDPFEDPILRAAKVALRDVELRAQGNDSSEPLEREVVALRAGIARARELLAPVRPWPSSIEVAERVRDKLVEAAQSGDTKTLSRSYNDVEEILDAMRAHNPMVPDSPGQWLYDGRARLVEFRQDGARPHRFGFLVVQLEPGADWTTVVDDEDWQGRA